MVFFFLHCCCFAWRILWFLSNKNDQEDERDCNHYGLDSKKFYYVFFGALLCEEHSRQDWTERQRDDRGESCEKSHRCHYLGSEPIARDFAWTVQDEQVAETAK